MKILVLGKTVGKPESVTDLIYPSKFRVINQEQSDGIVQVPVQLGLIKPRDFTTNYSLICPNKKV